LAAVVAGDAKPYTVGQVLAGATHGGVITSTTYHGGLKVAGFPHVATALVPAAVGSFDQFKSSSDLEFVATVATGGRVKVLSAV